MPVVKGKPIGPSLENEQRARLLEMLRNEISGNATASETNVSEIPLIFEIPLEGLDGNSDRFDVLVVWDAFDRLRSEERTGLILEAYKDQAAKIAQGLGVTRVEAMDQCLLPYRVSFTQQPEDAQMNNVIKAMLYEGGFKYGAGLELAFPTRAMANKAVATLHNQFPNLGWGIGERVSYN